MKKHKKKILVISIGLALMIGGIVMTLGTPFDHFLTHDYTKVSKEDQIKYLKKNEHKMTDYVKSQNPKVTSVQWDWESVKVETAQPNAGGIPTGDKYKILNIDGKFNQIDSSKIMIEYPFDKNSSYPNLNIFNIIDLSVLQNDGWYGYE